MDSVGFSLFDRSYVCDLSHHKQSFTVASSCADWSLLTFFYFIVSNQENICSSYYQYAFPVTCLSIGLQFSAPSFDDISAPSSFSGFIRVISCCVSRAGTAELSKPIKKWTLGLSVSYLIQENPSKRCTVSAPDETNHISNAPLQGTGVQTQLLRRLSLWGLWKQRHRWRLKEGLIVWLNLHKLSPDGGYQRKSL